MKRNHLILIILIGTTLLFGYSCQNSADLKQQMYYTNGRDLYIQHCENCHGKKGEGLSALIPPLTDTVFLKSNKNQLACFIKQGVSDTLSVAGQVYQDKMPGFPELADIDIAQVIVYITNTYGNLQGMYTPEEVARDMKQCRK